MCEASDHAQHDRTDKRECEIRGNNAQSAGESHGKPPLVHVAGRINAQTIKLFPHKKSQPCCSIAAMHRTRRLATWLKTHEINALKTR
jgi:hypothetical protein